jgi:hypothetical protein
MQTMHIPKATFSSLKNATSIGASKALSVGSQLANGLSTSCAPPGPPPDWENIVSAAMFCMTTIATIGYGSMVPTTAGSRLFLVPYACVGFWLYGLQLFTLSRYVNSLLQKFWAVDADGRGIPLPGCVKRSRHCVALVLCTLCALCRPCAACVQTP